MGTLELLCVKLRTYRRHIIVVPNEQKHKLRIIRRHKYGLYFFNKKHEIAYAIRPMI